ncbi:CBM35 domain-containing protein [Streptomyces sp. NPDC020799]|uniref:CBM35 domain-containing protein n=1 Tax=Streptomyces sp. NPDC020799 TaxID=3365091 RepID=UPI0037B95C5F
MTAGNNGSATPEGDDPFAHLYRSEGGDGSPEGGPAAPRPGVPRTSYHQVRTVGSRQYGQQNQTYGGQQPPQQPAPHYAAPETLPGGTPRQPGPPPGGHGGGPQRPKRRGLLVAAIAVVVVVAGGIGAAMITNSGTGDAKTNADGDNKPDQQNSAKPKEPKKDEPSNSSAAGLQQRDAATLNLSGGATTEKTVKGAQADGGLYITGMNKVGAGVEWEVDVKSAGEYRLTVRYGVPGTDNNLSVTTNGKKDDRSIELKNYGAKGWEPVWYTSWQKVILNPGKNTIKLSCESNNKCDVHLDQLSLGAD